MKILSFYLVPEAIVRPGDVLVTQDRTLERRESTKTRSVMDICMDCAIREDLCERGGFLCGREGYFVDIEPTEEIERARDLLTLKGELL